MNLSATGRKPYRLRLTHLVLPVAALVLAVRALAAGAPAASSGAKSDLDVTYLNLAPRYPAYDVGLTEGVPLLLDPATQEPLPPNGTDPIRRWPKDRELITATARVVNHGAAASAPFQYVWVLDGKKVETGNHAGLEARCAAEAQSTEWRLEGAALRQAMLRPGTFVDLSFVFPYKKKGQLLELRLEPAGVGTEELSAENNSRAEHTDSLAFAVLVRRSAYNRWSRLDTPEGGSFEDWIQRQFAALRQKLEQSTYATAPSGVRQPLRVDLIRVLDDSEAAQQFDGVHALNGWDGYVEYGTEREPAADAGRVDWELIRDLARQLGLVELQPLRILPEANHAGEAGEPGVGFEPPSALVTEDTLFPEHSVLALNRLTGTRRGYHGVYLYDVPRACRLRVFDNNGRLIPEAELTVFQARDGEIPAEPVARGKTDSNGEWPLPSRPAPRIRVANGFALTDNPFGPVDLNGSNGLFLFRIAAREQFEYQWLPITTLNQSFWRGQTALATFDLRTRIAPSHAPAAPQQVIAAREGGSLRTVHLEWARSAEADVSAYFLYRARYPSYQWERVGSVPAQRTAYSDTVVLPAGTTARFRYAVTAVDRQGNESGLARVRAELVIRGEDDDDG